MAENEGTVIAAPTVAELKSQMAKAMETEDYSAVAQLARQLKTAQSAERDAKDAATAQDRVDLTAKVMAAIGPRAEKFQQQVIELVGADRAEIVYSWSPANGVSCRIMKAAAPKAERKAKSPGAATAGAKGGPSTEEMLAQYGSELIKPGAEADDPKYGLTFKQVWDSSTDKNSRYGVRVALLKRHTQ